MERLSSVQIITLKNVHNIDVNEFSLLALLLCGTDHPPYTDHKLQPDSRETCGGLCLHLAMDGEK